MQRVRYFAVALLSAAVVVFAIQNLQPASVVFLVWRFEASVTLVIFVPFLVGLLTGGLAVWLARRGRVPGETPPSPPPPFPGGERSGP